MKIHRNDSALVIIDPQNDVLSEKGISWPLVGASVKENNTVENLARLFKAANYAPNDLQCVLQRPGRPSSSQQRLVA